MKLFSINYPRLPPAPENSVNAPRPKLVFLHGLGGNGGLWRPIAAALEDRCDLMCLDQRGHGKSATAPGETRFGPLDYAQDVVDTLQPAGFSPAWVIGHSMGVRTACGYAKLSPNGVQGLVLIDLGFSGVAGGGIGEALAQFLDRLPETFASRTEAREFLNAHCPDPSIAQYLLAVSQTDPQTQRLFFPFEHASLLKTIEASRGSDTGTWLEEYARSTGRPVHILRGAESRVFKKAEYEEARTRFAGLPNVQFHEIPGAGHGLPFEKRLDFVALLQSWIGIR